jgi:hypothetical protein
MYAWRARATLRVTGYRQLPAARNKSACRHSKGRIRRGPGVLKRNPLNKWEEAPDMCKNAGQPGHLGRGDAAPASGARLRAPGAWQIGSCPPACSKRLRGESTWPTGISGPDGNHPRHRGRWRSAAMRSAVPKKMPQPQRKCKSAPPGAA